MNFPYEDDDDQWRLTGESRARVNESFTRPENQVANLATWRCRHCTVLLVLVFSSIAMGAGLAIGQATARFDMQNVSSIERTPPAMSFRWGDKR